MIKIEKEGVVLKDDGTITTDEFKIYRDDYDSTEICLHSLKYHYNIYVSIENAGDLAYALAVAKNLWGNKSQ